MASGVITVRVTGHQCATLLCTSDECGKQDLQAFAATPEETPVAECECGKIERLHWWSHVFDEITVCLHFRNREHQEHAEEALHVLASEILFQCFRLDDQVHSVDQRSTHVQCSNSARWAANDLCLYPTSAKDVAGRRCGVLVLKGV